MKADARKVPVPGPWQPAVLAAWSDLSDRFGLEFDQVAVTRVEEAAEEEGALTVWLMAGGRGYRYRATLDGANAVPDEA